MIEDALNGKRGKNQKLIAETGLNWIETILHKNNDYGDSIFKPPVFASHLHQNIAIRVRLSDKFERLIHLLEFPAEVENETIKDTIKDFGAYLLLWLVGMEMNNESS